MATSLEVAASKCKGPSPGATMELDGYDYLRFRVGNAYQTMHFLRAMFGFTPLAYSGLETGDRDQVSYVLGQGRIRLIVTSPLGCSGEMANDIRVHGDAVSEIAFTVEDAGEMFHRALLAGACPVMEPTAAEDHDGRAVIATVRAFDNFTHSFIQRAEYTGPFLPGYQALVTIDRKDSGYLSEIDHVALSFSQGELDQSVSLHKGILGLEVYQEETVVTQYSAMNSKVVQNSSGTVRFPMMEPGSGQRQSQIEEYLRYNGGAGVQHVAFSCNAITEVVRTCRDAGVEFLKTPKAYYDLLSARVGSIVQNIEVLRDLNVLVDRDEWGHLLQIFTKPISGRPTLFFELIQREGARGFGSGNIRALFDAVEREQRNRGNL